MEQSQKITVIAAFLIGLAFLFGHSLGYNDALTDEKMRAEIRGIKEPKRISGERMIRAGYPGLPAHLRCPATNGRGQPLKEWHASRADSQDWQIHCAYEDAK